CARTVRRSAGTVFQSCVYAGMHLLYRRSSVCLSGSEKQSGRSVRSEASGSGTDAGGRKVLCILEDHSSEYHKWNHGIRHAGHVHRVWRFRNYQYTGRKLFPDRTDVPVFGNETVRTEGKCRDRDSVYYHAGNFTCGIWSAEKQEKEIRVDVLHRVSEYQKVYRKKPGIERYQPEH